MQDPRKALFAATLVLIFGTPFAVYPCASAQSIAPPVTAASEPLPVYDVMTIKLNNSASSDVDINTGNDRLSATNVSLKQLLEGVYDIKQDLISGISGPLDSARFDIEAKLVEPDPAAMKKMTQAQRRKMLLPLLTERFHLQVHTETKVLPVYDLILLPTGPKFKPSANQKEHDGGSISVSGNRTRIKLSTHDGPLTSLAKALAGEVHRTVIDKTGLTGNFDLTVQWSRDDNPDAGAEPLPDVFTAIQEQLGLKLVPAKGPVETLVVDHAEMPSGN